MTRIVLYDRELHEPLTIVEMSASWLRAVEDGTHPPYIRLVYQDQVPVDYHTFLENSDSIGIYHVGIKLEPVKRIVGRDRRTGNWINEIIFWYGYPDNPETALLLQATFLPGQIREVDRQKREEYMRGLFTGLML